MKKLYLIVVSILSLVFTMTAHAGTWSTPVLDYTLQYAFTAAVPLDPAYTNTVSASNSCTPGQYYRYYTITYTSAISRRFIKFYTQTCN